MSHKKSTLGSQFAGVFDKLKAEFDSPQTPQKKTENKKDDKDQRSGKTLQKRARHGSSLKNKKTTPGKRSYVEVKAPDTSCYDAPSSPPVPPRNNTQKISEPPPLRDISAEVEYLNILLPTSDAISDISIHANTEMTSQDGEPAIIGLDFGTAFTKVVIQWRNRHYIVDWKDVIDSKDPYLLPSSFSEHNSGSTVLGDVNEAGWTSKKGLKISIIENTFDNQYSDIDAIIFIALVTRHIRGWAEKTFKDMGAQKLRWRLHIGLPASPFQSEDTQNRLKKIANHAWSISLHQGVVSRISVEKLLMIHKTDNQIPIKVVPEFLAQLYPYLKSSKSHEGLHGLVDIGAGTVDFVIFNIVRNSDSDKIPIFGHNVSSLGAHYLIGALAGHKGQSLTWHDSDASKPFSFFSERTEAPHREISERARIFHQHLKKALSHAIKSARDLYRNSPVWKKENTFPFFLCGGGSHIDFYKQSIKDRKSQSIFYKNIPQPKNIVGDIKPKTFHRYSVAYGLSILPRNLPTITPTIDIEPIPHSTPIEGEDRDASR